MIVPKLRAHGSSVRVSLISIGFHKTVSFEGQGKIMLLVHYVAKPVGIHNQKFEKTAFFNIVPSIIFRNFQILLKRKGCFYQV